MRRSLAVFILLFGVRLFAAEVIPPAFAESGRLWSRLDEFTVTLYPFVQGRTASEMRLSEDQWVHFGAGLRMLHTTPLPADLAALVPRETYSPKGRDQVREFMKLAEETQRARAAPLVNGLVEIAKESKVPRQAGQVQWSTSGLSTPCV